MIVSLAVHSLFLFTYPLIADRNLSGLDAIKLSYRAALQNLSGIIGLLLLVSRPGDPRRARLFRGRVPLPAD